MSMKLVHKKQFPRNSALEINALEISALEISELEISAL